MCLLERKKAGAKESTETTAKRLLQEYYELDNPRGFKINQTIDTVYVDGILTERVLRKCLRCQELFIAYTRIIRCCYNCRKLNGALDD